METKEKGIVYFVGAGPGDPDLITLKGIKALQKADVVIYDRLVSEEILKHSPVYCEKIFAGKQRKYQSHSQIEINSLITHYATLGKVVIRLKGGDVSVFANMLDELKAVISCNIAFEIIPGITAASGAAAYTGVPLTARGISDEVHLLSLHNNGQFERINWSYYANLRGTLALYMSSAYITEVCKYLTEAGMKNQPLMIVEQASTCYQKTYISNLYAAQYEFAEKKFITPTIIILGNVVDLAESFRWVKENSHGLYFKKISKENYDGQQ